MKLFVDISINFILKQRGFMFQYWGETLYNTFGRMHWAMKSFTSMR
jgi:hypothetical protein